MTAAAVRDMPAASPSARREIVRLGVPFLLGVLSSSVDGVIDTAMIGRYGSNDLTAVAGGSAVLDVFITVAVASVVGHQILAARFAGRNDPTAIRHTLHSTAVFSALVVAPLVLCCVLLGRPLAALVSSGADAHVAHIAANFLLAVAPTLPLVVAFTAITATFNAFSLARQPMIAGLVVVAANVGLDYLFIYGPGPFPRLGATGDGLATSVAWLIGLVVLLAFARARRLGERLSRPNESTSPIDFETSVPRLSWPAMVSSGVDYTSTAVFFGILGETGAGALAGGRIAFHVLVLIYGLTAAFGAAARILVGRAVGAGRVDDVRTTWHAGRRILVGAGVAVGAALILLRHAIALIFTGDAGVRDQIAHALVVVGPIIPVLAWTLANLAVVRAFGRTRLDMYGNLIAAAVVQLPIAWALSQRTGLGTVGAFAGMAAYWIVRGSLVARWAKRCVAEFERESSDRPWSTEKMEQR